MSAGHRREQTGVGLAVHLLPGSGPPPRRAAAGLKELRVHPGLGTVINNDMSNDGQSSEET